MSISDVAKRASVSISTVSRVLNRAELVNASTRERVESAIRDLGYRPNGFARGLMLGRSELVGLVLPDLHGEFYSEIIRGADVQARRMGYNLVVSSIRDAEDGHSIVHTIRQRALLDGVALMVSEPTAAIRELLVDSNTPLVIMDNDISGAPHDSVIIDQRKGASMLMDHVLNRCGAKRVIFIGGLATNVDTRARYDAYVDSLASVRLKPGAGDVYYLDYEYESAFNLATRHIQQWSGAKTCVFAANDEMAAGVVAAATAAGLSIPNDLSVVGFDDTRIARMTHPPLTTVRVPMSEMGAKAIELLCERVADPSRNGTRVSLTPQLIVRESCGVLQGRNGR